MKTVFDNRQVSHVWAQQSQARGRSNNGNVFFEGKTIYSYGYHFPMGYFIKPDTVLLNSDSYSNSTGKQQGYVRNAVSHKTRLYVSTRLIKAFSEYKDNNHVLFPPQVQDLAVQEAFHDFDTLMERASKRRIKRCKAEDIQQAIRRLETCAELFEALNEHVPPELNKAIKQYKEENFGALDNYIKEKQKKAEQEALKKAEQYAKVKALWLAHKNLADTGTDGRWLAYGATLLRVSADGKEIETSRGARFPVDHAIKAFKIIRLLKDNKQEYELQHDKEGGYRLGHFKIDKISAKGDVLAGCHNVPWESIEHAATVLKIYP